MSQPSETKPHLDRTRIDYTEKDGGIEDVSKFHSQTIEVKSNTVTELSDGTENSDNNEVCEIGIKTDAGMFTQKPMVEDQGDGVDCRVTHLDTTAQKDIIDVPITNSITGRCLSNDRCSGDIQQPEVCTTDHIAEIVSSTEDHLSLQPQHNCDDQEHVISSADARATYDEEPCLNSTSELQPQAPCLQSSVNGVTADTAIPCKDKVDKWVNDMLQPESCINSCHLTYGTLTNGNCSDCIPKYAKHLQMKDEKAADSQTSDFYLTPVAVEDSPGLTSSPQEVEHETERTLTKAEYFEMAHQLQGDVEMYCLKPDEKVEDGLINEGKVFQVDLHSVVDHNNSYGIPEIKRGERLVNKSEVIETNISQVDQQMSFVGSGGEIEGKPDERHHREQTYEAVPSPVVITDTRSQHVAMQDANDTSVVQSDDRSKDEAVTLLMEYEVSQSAQMDKETVEQQQKTATEIKQSSFLGVGYANSMIKDAGTIFNIQLGDKAEKELAVKKKLSVQESDVILSTLPVTTSSDGGLFVNETMDATAKQEGDTLSTQHTDEVDTVAVEQTESNEKISSTALIKVSGDEENTVVVGIYRQITFFREQQCNINTSRNIHELDETVAMHSAQDEVTVSDDKLFDKQKIVTQEPTETMESETAGIALILDSGSGYPTGHHAVLKTDAYEDTCVMHLKTHVLQDTEVAYQTKTAENTSIPLVEKLKTDVINNNPSDGSTEPPLPPPLLEHSDDMQVISVNNNMHKINVHDGMLERSVQDNMHDGSVLDDMHKGNVHDDLHEGNVRDDLHKGSVHNDLCEGSVRDDLHDGNVSDDLHEGSVHDDLCEGSVRDDLHEGNVCDDLHEGSVHDDLCEGSARDDLHEGNVRDDLHEGSVHDDLCEGSVRDDLHEGNVRDDLHEGSVHDDLHEGNVCDDLHEGSVHDDLCEGSVRDDLHEGNVRDDLHEGNVRDDLHEGNVHDDLHEGNVCDDLHEGSVHDDLCEGSVRDDLHEGNVRDDLHEGNVRDDLHEGNVRDDLHEGNVRDDLHEGNVRDDLHEGSMPNGISVHNDMHERSACNDMLERNVPNDSHNGSVHDDMHKINDHDGMLERSVRDKMHDGSVHDDLCEGSVHDDLHEGSVHDDLHEGSVRDDLHEGSMHNDMLNRSVPNNTHERSVCNDMLERNVPKDSHNESVHDDMHKINVHDDMHDRSVCDDMFERYVHDNMHEGSVHDYKHEGSVHDDMSEVSVLEKMHEERILDDKLDRSVCDDMFERYVHDNMHEGSVQGSVHDYKHEGSVHNDMCEVSVHEKMYEESILDDKLDRSVHDGMHERSIHDEMLERKVPDDMQERSVHDGMHEESVQGDIYERSFQDDIHERNADDDMHERSSHDDDMYENERNCHQDRYTRIKSCIHSVACNSKLMVQFASPLASYIEYSNGESSCSSEDTQDAMETMLYLNNDSMYSEHDLTFSTVPKPWAFDNDQLRYDGHNVSDSCNISRRTDFASNVDSKREMSGYISSSSDATEMDMVSPFPVHDGILETERTLVHTKCEEETCEFHKCFSCETCHINTFSHRQNDAFEGVSDKRQEDTNAFGSLNLHHVSDVEVPADNTVDQKPDSADIADVQEQCQIIEQSHTIRDNMKYCIDELLEIVYRCVEKHEMSTFRAQERFVKETDTTNTTQICDSNDDDDASKDKVQQTGNKDVPSENDAEEETPSTETVKVMLCDEIVEERASELPSAGRCLKSDIADDKHSREATFSHECDKRKDTDISHENNSPNKLRKLAVGHIEDVTCCHAEPPTKLQENDVGQYRSWTQKEMTVVAEDQEVPTAETAHTSSPQLEESMYAGRHHI